MYTVRLRLTVDADLESVEELVGMLEQRANAHYAVIETKTTMHQWESGQGSGRPPNDRRRASRWLVWFLSRQGKPVPAADVYASAERAGIRPRTLRRAADELNIVKTPPVGPQTAWSLESK
jgi:hypothetical protein